MLWGKNKFSCCVLCREVVLFSEVQNALNYKEINQIIQESHLSLEVIS